MKNVLKKEFFSTKKISKLSELLFMDKEMTDVNLICDGKTYQCHQLVLSCRSDVFKAMFHGETKMVESEAGVVEIEGTNSDALETMIYFMYHGEVLDEKKINVDLLFLAERYNVQPLSAVCIENLAQKMTPENAMDTLVSAYHLNQESLFNVAKNFILDKREDPIIINSWKELKKSNKTRAFKIMTAMLSPE